MKRTQYHIENFSYEALDESLLLVIDDEYTEEYIYDKNEDGTITEGFIGVGIGVASGDAVIVTIEGTHYFFNRDGSPRSYNTNGYILKNTTIVDNASVSGNEQDSIDIIIEGEDSEDPEAPVVEETLTIDSFNVRDTIALTVLPEILRKLDDISVMSNTKRRYYCEAAYKWADSMLKVTASERVLNSSEEEE